ncbi:MAG: hypothetical protein PHT33_00770 [bacterium]|nr:hypothetical protein [bacterium]
MNKRYEWWKLHIGLFFLLPYVAFAFCHSFMHVCLCERYKASEPACLSQAAAEQAGMESPTLLHADKPSSGNHDTCTGCAWTKSCLSVKQSVSVSILPERIFPFVSLQPVAHYPEPAAAVLSRGPPAGRLFS